MGFGGPVPGIPQAVIRDAEGPLPPHLPGGAQVGVLTEANSGAVLFEIPRIARYLIRGGSSIAVEAAPKADSRAVELFLHGSARGFLIHQRGELPLEASTLITPGGACIAICSFSSIGKSTLAAELCRRGWTLLSDGITRVTSENGRMTAWPGQSRLSLWRDACERLGQDVAKLTAVREGLDKYFVDVTATDRPSNLTAIVKLRVESWSGIADVPPPQKSGIISDHVFHASQSAAFGQQQNFNRLLAQITQSVPAYYLSGAQLRPPEEIAGHLVGKFS